jgi:hypothetical protein
MKNVDYIASGYDIFYGNPHATSTGSDPGFQAKIFDLAFQREESTDD